MGGDDKEKEEFVTNGIEDGGRVEFGDSNHGL